MTSNTTTLMRPTLRITIPARANYTTETTVRPYLRLRIFEARELPPHEPFPYWSSMGSDTEWLWQDRFLLSPMVALTASPQYFRYSSEYPRWRTPPPPRSEEGDWEGEGGWEDIPTLAEDLEAAQLNDAGSSSDYEGEGHARTESSDSDRVSWSGCFGGMPISRIYADLVRRGDTDDEEEDDQKEEDVERGSASAAARPSEEVEEAETEAGHLEETEERDEESGLLPYPGQDGEYTFYDDLLNSGELEEDDDDRDCMDQIIPFEPTLHPQGEKQQSTTLTRGQIFHNSPSLRKVEKVGTSNMNNE